MHQCRKMSILNYINTARSATLDVVSNYDGLTVAICSRDGKGA